MTQLTLLFIIFWFVFVVNTFAAYTPIPASVTPTSPPPIRTAHRRPLTNIYLCSFLDRDDRGEALHSGTYTMGRFLAIDRIRELMRSGGENDNARFIRSIHSVTFDSEDLPLTDQDPKRDRLVSLYTSRGCTHVYVFITGTDMKAALVIPHAAPLFPNITWMTTAASIGQDPEEWASYVQFVNYTNVVILNTRFHEAYYLAGLAASSLYIHGTATTTNEANESTTNVTTRDDEHSGGGYSSSSNKPLSNSFFQRERNCVAFAVSEALGVLSQENLFAIASNAFSLGLRRGWQVAPDVFANQNIDYADVSVNVFVMPRSKDRESSYSEDNRKDDVAYLSNMERFGNCSMFILTSFNPYLPQSYRQLQLKTSEQKREALYMIGSHLDYRAVYSDLVLMTLHDVDYEQAIFDILMDNAAVSSGLVKTNGVSDGWVRVDSFSEYIPRSWMAVIEHEIQCMKTFSHAINGYDPAVLSSNPFLEQLNKVHQVNDVAEMKEAMWRERDENQNSNLSKKVYWMASPFRVPEVHCKPGESFVYVKGTLELICHPCPENTFSNAPVWEGENGGGGCMPCEDGTHSVMGAAFCVSEKSNMIELSIIFSLLALVFMFGVVQMVRYLRFRYLLWDSVRFAPRHGPVAVVYVDVDWQNYYIGSLLHRTMRHETDLLRLRNVYSEQVRLILRRQHGYEARVLDDSFTLVFAQPSRALEFALIIQDAINILEDEWIALARAEGRVPPSEEDDPSTPTAPYSRGFRIRVAGHYGNVDIHRHRTDTKNYLHQRSSSCRTTAVTPNRPQQPPQHQALTSIIGSGGADSGSAGSATPSSTPLVPAPSTTGGASSRGGASSSNLASRLRKLKRPFTYHGDVVDLPRLIALAAHGGHTILTHELYDVLMESLNDLGPNINITLQHEGKHSFAFSGDIDGGTIVATELYSLARRDEDSELISGNALVPPQRSSAMVPHPPTTPGGYPPPARVEPTTTTITTTAPAPPPNYPSYNNNNNSVLQRKDSCSSFGSSANSRTSTNLLNNASLSSRQFELRERARRMIPRAGVPFGLLMQNALRVAQPAEPSPSVLADRECLIALIAEMLCEELSTDTSSIGAAAMKTLAKSSLAQIDGVTPVDDGVAPVLGDWSRGTATLHQQRLRFATENLRVSWRVLSRLFKRLHSPRAEILISLSVIRILEGDGSSLSSNGAAAGAGASGSNNNNSNNNNDNSGGTKNATTAATVRAAMGKKTLPLDITLAGSGSGGAAAAAGPHPSKKNSVASNMSPNTSSSHIFSVSTSSNTSGNNNNNNND
eukprot:PhM_4_TR15965/c3_g1_i1/m.45695